MEAKLAERLGVAKGCVVALDAMKQYGENAAFELEVMEQDFLALSEYQRRLAAGFQPRLARMRSCVADNARVLNDVLAFHRASLRNRFPALRKRTHKEDKVAADDDDDDDAEFSHECCGGMEHVRGARADPEHQAMAKNLFMQFYREWSVAGAAERSECYRPAVDLALRHKPPGSASTVHAFVPGAGFCRLPWDLVMAGYTVDACEPSHAMLLPAQYILAGNSGAVWPFAHVTANIPTADAMLFTRAEFPDAPVDSALVTSRLSVSNTDFVSAARAAPRGGKYELLVTCFFVDTAFNVVDYVEAAAAVLKPGGVWVNVGPLHWVHSPRESLRLTIEEIHAVMEQVGFEFLERGRLPYCHYCSPPTSLMPMVFDCVTWAARISH